MTCLNPLAVISCLLHLVAAGYLLFWADLSRSVLDFPVQTKEQKSAIETAIDSAKETCESGSAGACATAWDEVCGAAVPPCTWLTSSEFTYSLCSALNRWRSCLPVQLTRSRQRALQTLWTSTVMITQKQMSAGKTICKHYSFEMQSSIWCFIVCHACVVTAFFVLSSYGTATCRVYED